MAELTVLKNWAENHIIILMGGENRLKILPGRYQKRIRDPMTTPEEIFASLVYFISFSLYFKDSLPTSSSSIPSRQYLKDS